jgi:hypothetical protein
MTKYFVVEHLYENGELVAAKVVASSIATLSEAQDIVSFHKQTCWFQKDPTMSSVYFAKQMPPLVDKNE